MGSVTLNAGTTTWAAPAGVSVLTKVTVIGAGGAGGTATTNGTVGGGGGGGAVSIITNLSVTPAQTTYCSIPTGGTPGTTAGDAWFNKTSNASPGSTADGAMAKAGASGSATSDSTGRSGGASGSGVGSTKYSGGSGAAGVDGSYGGGGGSGAASTANGNNASTSTAGSATDISGAGGGGATTDNTAGTAGTTPGGGGGGGRRGTGSNRAGGNGGAAQIVLEWTDPVAVSFSGTVPGLTATQGQAFSQSLASYFSGDFVPLAYTVHAGTLPAGLTLNSSTGVISGTPTAQGTSSGLVVRATDSASNTADSNSFAITVEGWRVYAVAYPAALGSSITGPQVFAGQNPSGGAATAAGDIEPTAGTNNWPSDLTGLAPGTSYRNAMVGKRGATYTAVSVTDAWQTLNIRLCLVAGGQISLQPAAPGDLVVHLSPTGALGAAATVPSGHRPLSLSGGAWQAGAPV